MGREIRPGEPGDDRRDRPMRDRIDELTASWHAAVERLDARYARVARVVTGAVVIGLLALGVAVIQYRNAKQDAHRNTTALCVLRADLQRRVRDGEAFMAKHPEGLAGLSGKTLQATIDGQKRTIKALSIVDCSSVDTSEVQGTLTPAGTPSP